jgi:hypothetical protein
MGRESGCVEDALGLGASLGFQANAKDDDYEKGGWKGSIGAIGRHYICTGK